MCRNGRASRAEGRIAPDGASKDVRDLSSSLGHNSHEKEGLIRVIPEINARPMYCLPAVRGSCAF